MLTNVTSSSQNRQTVVDMQDASLQVQFGTRGDEIISARNTNRMIETGLGGMLIGVAVAGLGGIVHIYDQIRHEEPSSQTLILVWGGAALATGSAAYAIYQSIKDYVCSSDRGLKVGSEREPLLGAENEPPPYEIVDPRPSSDLSTYSTEKQTLKSDLQTKM